MLDQPAIIIECTLKEDNARRYSKPKLKSVEDQPLPKGITTQLATAKPQVNIGANKKIIILALFGNILSLANSFKASAMV